MANVYVRSGAGGAGTGADWTNAYTTLSAALTAKAAGDVFWVAADHNESTAGVVTLTSPGTEATPCRIFCAIHTGSVPPVAADLRTTAQITTTGGNGISMANSVSECYGIVFNCGTGSTQANLTTATTGSRFWKYVNCAFKTLTTNNASRIIAGTCTWENCTVQFGAVAQAVQLTSNTRFTWRNTVNALAGAIIPTSFFNTIASGFALIEGCDFSALIAGKALVAINPNGGTIIFKNCKLNSAAGIVTSLSAGGLGGGQVDLIGCDSGDTNYRNERHNFLGQQTTETTIVRTGGATDGTTPVSWKIVTTADVEKEVPFEAMPITVWNETVGTVTVTVQGIWGGGATPLSDEIWMDVEYLGTSGFPLVSKATCGRATPLTSGASLPAGSGTWGGSTTKFALSVTVMVAEKGPVTCYVKAGAVSATYYVDPKPVIT